MQIHVPDEIKSIEPDLKRFVDAMIYKLVRNSHKGKWENMTAETLIVALFGEANELHEAILIGNSLEIVMEAADVANFAMMTSSVALTEQFNGSGGKKSGDRPEMVNSENYKNPERGRALFPSGKDYPKI